MEENMLISVPPAPHRDPPTTRAERLTCSSSNLTCCHFKLSCKLQCCHLGVTSCSLTIRLVLFSETLTFALFVCWFSSYFFFWATVQRIGANSVLLIHVLLFLIFPACLHSCRDSGCCWLSNVEGKTNWTSHAHLNLCSRSDSMSLNNCPVTATVSSLR